MAPDDLAIVLTTVDDDALADTLATALVEQRIAACVQTTEVRSTYRWAGEVRRDRELLLAIKCRAADFARVEAAIRVHHTYDVPEIVQVPITAASADYVAWLQAETRDGPP